ncbi:hypothetical protein SASPL_146035 [Salvia splendens]|uniref:Xylanase inhibitor N-terminal domain-containing protein n=1 Tax=Salvia splendens TaxID=180675 RepID=A0A8X8WIT3_SALSN|nr:hypothetical protein SASPL_146035 [Salvia splendens]
MRCFGAPAVALGGAAAAEIRDEPSPGEPPPQEVVLIADTGSDLTWSKCSRGEVQGGRVFHADRSSSFRTFPCSSAVCKTDLADLSSLSRCPSMLDPCSYDYR